MGMRTVFIRKENEDFFDGIEKKSEFINALIGKEKAGNKLSHESVGRLQDEIIARKEHPVIEQPIEKVIKSIDEDLPRLSAGTVCKHNSSPQFCKFAKPGKPCK